MVYTKPVPDYRQTLSAIPPCHPSFDSLNPLLVKDDVGKSKPSTRNLPEDGFTYGKALDRDEEGVREVTSLWVSHNARPRPEERIQDFRRLNKMATATGIVDPKGQTIQRSQRRDVTIRHLSGGLISQDNKNLPASHGPYTTYGRGIRPSTPVANVISHQFGRESQEKTAERYCKYLDNQRRTATTHKIKTTTAAIGHSVRAGTHQNAVANQSLRTPFKMTKFLKTDKRTETFAGVDWRKTLSQHAGAPPQESYPAEAPEPAGAPPACDDAAATLESALQDAN
uniref:Uncharacterized protein n=1 Tax=Chromera velia CCMP2878 TaxID=1169474 RepID=A0A0G4IAS1_9ALVE|eukprot:Cvel_12536.t1-p1 / transcript=Cvel_12536.t1 / gene=Cvel_12536 / organism=Chromera_velia_CCMP2878 / gene_product=Uncharacterized protein FLJ46082 homolog, putative / transcript_product=Uncharacterized protein FLJ46082 homolog, putative / location=Cvel_scaffold823:43296-44141(+) / protein_length=282 / sequence_SO=supercontig / SO=protein_coding / is_pseudo=false